MKLFDGRVKSTTELEDIFECSKEFINDEI
jgi:hypothetical protein